MMDNYKNERAKEEGIDPRQRLEKLVLSNTGSVSYDQIMEKAPDLKAYVDDDWLTEYVRSNDPYTVLETCFYDDALKSIATEQYNIAEDTDDIISEILYELGYKKKIKPIGLSQYLQDIERLQNNFDEMLKAVDDLLRKLFLFYSYILRWNAFAEADINGAASDIVDTDDEDPIHAIETLLKNYRKKAASISLGDLYIWLKTLMELVRKNVKLSNYCQKHFQCEVPLNKNYIAEIGMFRTYRNLTSSGHLINPASWKKHKDRSETDLDDMDSTTRMEWEPSWKNVISRYEESQELPKEQMLLRMASFFRKFLNSLSENRIFPKVIVLHSYETDEYGTIKIHASSSDPNDGKGIHLTDYSFQSFSENTFTEFYYHSRTNPTGIEPILVATEDLDDWSTGYEENTEN